jgi:Cytochrome c oxidase subunit VIc
MFVKCGANLRESMFIENFIVALAFVGVLHRWAWEMLRDRLAALLTPLLVLLNGGFGWLLFLSDIKNQKSGVLVHLRSSFTIGESGWRWGNAFSTLLVTQRGMLLGLPLAVIVFTQWWVSQNIEEGKGKKEGKSKKAKSKKAKLKEEGTRARSTPSLLPSSFFLLPSVRRMIAAGFVAGLLPLVHAHSFVVVMAMSACLALLQRRWREWIVFAVVGSLIALPQMWWSTRGSAVSASTFFGWEFGWDHGTENPIWFWFKNTGLFIPAIAAAFLWRGKKPLVSRRLLLFYLPFTLCFIVPNVVKLAPWIWDNVKVLFYWWLASAPLVALLVSRLWHQGSIRRVLSIALFVCITLAGALDVGVIVSRSEVYKTFYRQFLDESTIEQFFVSGQYQVFDRNGLEFAELVKQQTRPRSLLVHAPVHNTPVFLTGRRSLMGYPGHIWTHGLEFREREAEIKRIYSGAPDAGSLIKKYGIEYAVVGPLERMAMPVNEQFFSRFEKVGEIGDYRLYKTQP